MSRITSQSGLPRFVSYAVAAALATFDFALAPVSVRAEPARDVALSTVAPPDADCGPAERLRTLVETRVGSSVFMDAGNARRLIHVHIRAAENEAGVSAALVVRDLEGRVLGERTVTTASPRCDSLEPMLVLVISTLIGLTDMRPPPAATRKASRDDALTRQDSKPELAPRTPTTSASAGTADRSPAPAEPRTMPSGSAAGLRLALGLGAQATSGLLPGIASLAALDLLARFGSLELRAGIAATPRLVTDLGAGARVNFTALLGQTVACGIATERLGGPLSVCLGARAGGLWAQRVGRMSGSANTSA